MERGRRQCPRDKSALQGTCWNRRKQGHRSTGCRTRATDAVMESKTVEDGQSEEYELGGIWPLGMVNAVDVREPHIDVGVAHYTRLGSRFRPLEDHSPPSMHLFVVGAMLERIRNVRHRKGASPSWSRPPLTRLGATGCNVADVKKPLASAAKIAKAGNTIVLELGGSYVMEKNGERAQARMQDEAFVFDRQYKCGQVGTTTLHSVAGVQVWPKDLLPDVPTKPIREGL